MYKKKRTKKYKTKRDGLKRCLVGGVEMVVDEWGP